MSDLENELLGLAEDDPGHHSKKRGAAGSSRKSKSQAFEDDSDDNNEGEMDMDMDMDEEDMEMDVDSDDDATSRPVNKTNPYPLEGKYIDEDDRDRLEAMPEIEREELLAARQEEIQKFKDAAQLDAMYKMAAGGDDEEDYVSSRKQRKHTSVSNEARKAMMDLRDSRKAKEEKAQRRALKLAQGGRRARSSSLASQEEASSEEGEISARDNWRQPSPSRGRVESRREKEVDIDAVPPNYQELNAARLSRYELVDMMYKDQFENVVKNAYVRVMAGNEADEQGRPKYRIQRIANIEAVKSRYPIEYKGLNYSSNLVLNCTYGKGERQFRIADVSNGDVTETEFSRFTMTNKADGVKNPRRSELKAKHEAIAMLRDRVMTEDEVNRQVEDRKQTNTHANRQKIQLEITSLKSSKDLAMRRNDLEAVAEISRKIVDLGGDPATGQLVDADGDMSAYDLRIAKINENNRKKTRETMVKAHEAAVAKKKAEDAIVRAKAAAAAKEGSSEPLVKEITIKAPPISGLRKSETPQQYVARTVVLDLGDF